MTSEARDAGGEERFREELLRLTAELGPQVARLFTVGHRRAQTSTSSDFGELRLRRAQSSRRAVESSSRGVEGGDYAVIEEELRRLREAAAAGHTVRRIRHDFNDLLVGIHWQAQGLKHGSSPGDEIHKAAEAVSDAARRIMELMEQWRGSARDALLGITGGCRPPSPPRDTAMLYREAARDRRVFERRGHKKGVTHIQPFVDETIRTFDLMLAASVRKVGEEKKESAGSAYDLSGTVGISGSATGGVVLSLPEDAACKIVSRLLCKEVDEVNPDVEDVVAELVNVISARAKRALERQGLTGLRFSLPRVVVGKGRSVWPSRELPCISVSLLAEELGPFRIEISIRPTSASSVEPVGESRALHSAVAEGAGEYGPAAATPGKDTGEGRAAMKILLVDDSVILRKFVARVMADIDDIPIELVETATGPEALAAAREHGSSIDLILCDVGIPDIDGLSVLEEVKKTTDARSACVVIITGDVSDETVRQALKGGAAGFLVKPFSQDELTRLVREVHSRLARGLTTATGDGLPLSGPSRGPGSETSGEPPSDDGPSQDEGS